MRFAVGDLVWIASWETQKKYVTCPDCGGTGRIRVIFHDETQVSIECQRCQSGFNPPSGRLVHYERSPVVRCEAITGVELTDNSIEWKTKNHYRVADGDVFATETDAVERAAQMSAQANADDLQRIAMKEKDTRSWAWNASYHRREIKDAQRRIEYHTAKLNVAKVKAKETIP